MQPTTALIATGNPELEYMLQLRCKRSGLTTQRSSDAVDAVASACRNRPGLMILDADMLIGKTANICQLLSEDESLASIPMIILAAEGLMDDGLERCRELGAHLVCKSSRIWDEVKPFVERALAEHAPEPAAPDAATKPNGEPAMAASAGNPTKQNDSQPRAKLLCIDDDPDISMVIKHRLEPLGVDVVRAFSGMQGFWSCLDFRPDVVITDMNMPDGDGNYIFYRLQSHPLTQNVPVIILTGQSNVALKRQLMSQGADAYLTKPLVFDQLVGELQRHIDIESEPGRSVRQRMAQHF